MLLMPRSLRRCCCSLRREVTNGRLNRVQLLEKLQAMGEELGASHLANKQLKSRQAQLEARCSVTDGPSATATHVHTPYTYVQMPLAIRTSTRANPAVICSQITLVLH
jgi:hypothetical protein